MNVIATVRNVLKCAFNILICMHNKYDDTTVHTRGHWFEHLAKDHNLSLNTCFCIDAIKATKMEELVGHSHS